MLALAVGCGTCASARAADRLMLAWDGCRVEGGTADAVQGCADISAHRYLVCSFQLAAPIDSVIGAEFVLDLQSAASPLPAFWQLGAGGCNQGGLVPSFPAPGACADAWNGLGSAIIVDAIPGQPRGLASMLRIRAVATVASTQARAFEAGIPYNAIQFDLGIARMGNCADCEVPACLVLNSMWLRRLPGAADVLISGDGGAHENFATWQGGVGADCLTVPARPSSWGRIKVLYR